MSKAAASPEPEFPHPPADGKSTVVACLGASITEAKGSFDWVAELAARECNRHVRFRKFGVGGDLSYNALQRLPEVIACRPDKVVILIGSNDAITAASRKVRRIFRTWKKLPKRPTPEWYRENLRAIVRRLKSETSASVGLCSLPPIGEAAQSANPFQRELNRRIEEIGAIIREVAREEALDYIPVHEAMQAEIAATPGRAFTGFWFLAFYRDAFRLRVLGRSLDDLARLNGWRIHTDGIHLNSCGGMMLAELVQRYIEGKDEIPKPLSADCADERG